MRVFLRVALVAFAAWGFACGAWAQEQLPSWNEGPAKRAIVDFVADVTATGAPTFVPPAQRIAVFDNDGTLWAEQPMYFQLAFMLDQVRAAAAKHPEWKGDPAFKALVAGDFATLMADRKALGRLLAAANSGMTTAEYDGAIRGWLARARHPKFNRPYTDLVYAPMVELLDYLRANGFATYIVSGGGVQFMRPWVEEAYGIPPEHVIGSLAEVKFATVDGKPALVREPKIAFVDDGPGKPVGIYRSIGRQPIFAFGNSDGDWQMLQWTASGEGPRFMGLLHHTDATREFAYDRKSKIGKLDKAWDDAVAKGWTVVDMKNDWSRVFAFQ
jgi:phosphoglycolate phosphatase-like HAD superfamily hydrolase